MPGPCCRWVCWSFRSHLSPADAFLMKTGHQLALLHWHNSYLGPAATRKEGASRTPTTLLLPDGALLTWRVRSFMPHTASLRLLAAGWMWILRWLSHCWYCPHWGLAGPPDPARPSGKITSLLSPVHTLPLKSCALVVRWSSERDQLPAQSTKTVRTCGIFGAFWLKQAGPCQKGFLLLAYPFQVLRIGEQAFLGAFWSVLLAVSVEVSTVLWPGYMGVIQGNPADSYLCCSSTIWSRGSHSYFQLSASFNSYASLLCSIYYF